MSSKKLEPLINIEPVNTIKLKFCLDQLWDKPVIDPIPEFKMVGYWSSSSKKDQYPDPKKLVDSHWDLKERLLVIDYLKSGRENDSFRGFSMCRFCECMNGSRDYTDGVYLWPEGFMHYLEIHSVKPDLDFINHVLMQKGINM